MEAMFIVKWVIRDQEREPILIETGFLTTLAKVVSSCRRRLPVIRADHPATPPDGFIVLESDGTEVHRWFQPLDPDAQAS
jgi:hypothetical protein